MAERSVNSSSNSSTSDHLVQVNMLLPRKVEITGDMERNWRRCRLKWDNYKSASRLRNEPKELRTVTLVTCIWPGALTTYKGLAFTDERDRQGIDILLQKLAAFYLGETNVIYKRFKFYQPSQEPGESFNVFLAALRTLAKSCDCGSLANDQIKDKIVVGVRDNNLRKTLLQSRDLSLTCVEPFRRSQEGDEGISFVQNKNNPSRVEKVVRKPAQVTLGHVTKPNA